MAPKGARWRHPRIFFLVFFALACVAFGSLRELGGTTGSVIEDAYHSIGIFTANGSWAFDPANHVNLLFRVLATATPVVTFIGFVELLTGGVIPFVMRQRGLARLRLGGAGGTLVCGLTGHGLAFARAVARRGTLVFVLEDSPDDALLDLCTREHIPVLPWRTLDRPRTASLLFRRCDLISFLPSTDRQIDLVARIDARLGPSTDRSFWFLIEERGLAQRLDGYLRFTASNSALRPRFFDIDALAARQVLAKHPLDVLADALNQQQIHIAILGFGALGRAIVKEAARSVVTLPSLADVSLKVTVIDADAGAAAAALEAEDPQIRQLLDLDCIDMVVPPAGLGAVQVAELPGDVTAYFVTVGNTELAFAAAVSIRHWLLEPPEAVSDAWRRAHACVPVMIRVRDWDGLGRLIRSNVDWPAQAERAPELPDGIFGFGVTQDILDPAFIMSEERETGARTLHQSYRASGEVLRGLAGTPDARRVAEREWRELASDLRDLNLYGYDHIAMKARAIGHRIVPRAGGAAPTEIPASVMPGVPLLSRLEHCRYLAERVAGGWRHASTRCDELRLHPDLVDWADLPSLEQLLDERHVHSMFQALAATGRRMLPALVIGIIEDGAAPRSASLRASLRSELAGIVESHPDAAPLVLTTLAPGAGMDAAEAAQAMGLAWVAILPLPFELYREDFAPEERRRLQALIAHAERYVELPLRFGRASELTRGHAENLARRAQQFALASAFIVERSHALIAVGETSALPWWTGSEPIPDAYQTAAAFLPRPPVRHPPLVLAP